MPINSNIPQCQYIRTDGRRCGSPALKTKRWCYFHYEVNRKTVTLDVPPLEDGNAVQLALTDLARAVADDRIQLKNAALLAYILQTASANLKQVQLGVFTSSMVRDLPDLDPYSRGPAREDAPPVGGQGFNPAEKNGALAPSALPKARVSEGHDFSRAENAGPTHPSALPKAGAQPAGAAPMNAPFAQKLQAAQSGSLKDARELLDLLNAVS